MCKLVGGVQAIVVVIWEERAGCDMRQLACHCHWRLGVLLKLRKGLHTHLYSKMLDQRKEQPFGQRTNANSQTSLVLMAVVWTYRKQAKA